ncbi:MAG: alpha/beta fold hydrolase [Actinomycetota bacterium]
MSTIEIMRGAEPWGSDGDRTGALFLHGFTGTPQSVRAWAEGVARDGHTVLVPRLPGHGTTVADMQTTSAEDWVGEAEMSLRGLRERCDRIFVCGLSMGGTLTLDIAARLSEWITGIIVVNPAVYTTDPRRVLAPLLGRLPLTLKGVAGDIADPEQSELAYDRVPTKAASSMLGYQDRVKARLGSVRAPALVFTSRQDHVVNPGNGPFVIEHIASSDKELVWLERSYHVATLDFDRDLILERTIQFIKERTD